jgi:hypothetical protein
MQGVLRDYPVRLRQKHRVHAPKQGTGRHVCNNAQRNPAALEDYRCPIGCQGSSCFDLYLIEVIGLRAVLSRSYDKPICHQAPSLRSRRRQRRVQEADRVPLRQNNYGGTVKRLNLIAEKSPDWTSTRHQASSSALKREGLIASNSMILDELFFDGLGEESAPGRARVHRHAAGHCHTLADGRPILARDMYESPQPHGPLC